MKSGILIAAAVLCLSAGNAFAQTNVTGDWMVTIQSPQGANTVRVSFKQDGEKVSGVFRGQQGELPFDGGTLTGDDLKFAFSVPFQGAALEITLTGKVDGASMTGKANFGGFAEGDWSAKRAEATGGVPAPAPPTPAPAATTSATGVSGKWDVTVKTQMGDVPATADLTENAGKVTGTITGPAGEVQISGTLEGSTLKLAFTAQTPQGDMPITLTGDLTGDAIAGKAEFGGMGQAEWTAKRKQ